jgi:ABC-type sugar transport system ATPase subunit
MLFQYAALFDSLTVEENIVFPLVEHGDPDSIDEDEHGKPRKRRFFSRAELHQIAVTQLDKLALPQVLLRSFRRSCPAVSASASVWRGRW